MYSDKNDNDFLGCLGILMIGISIYFIFITWCYIGWFIVAVPVSTLVWNKIGKIKSKTIKKSSLYFIRPITISLIFLTIYTFIINSALFEDQITSEVIKSFILLQEIEHKYVLALAKLPLWLFLAVSIILIFLSLKFPKSEIATKFYRARFFFSQIILVLFTVSSYSLVIKKTNNTFSDKINDNYRYKIQFALYKYVESESKVLSLNDLYSQVSDLNVNYNEFLNKALSGFYNESNMYDDLTYLGLDYSEKRSFDYEINKILSETIIEEIFKETKINNQNSNLSKIETIEHLLNANKEVIAKAKTESEWTKKIDLLNEVNARNQFSEKQISELIITFKKAFKSTCADFIFVDLGSMVIESKGRLNFLDVFLEKLILNYSEKIFEQRVLKNLLLQKNELKTSIKIAGAMKNEHIKIEEGKTEITGKINLFHIKDILTQVDVKQKIKSRCQNYIKENRIKFRVSKAVKKAARK